MANITLQELREKHEAAKKRREMLIAHEKQKMEPHKKKEEGPKESEKVEEFLEEKAEEQEKKQEKAPAKKGRKPAQREYMVVEDIESVND